MGKKSKNKINYWVLLLVVLLVLGVVLSRTRRASKRSLIRHPATDQPVEEKKSSRDTINEQYMKTIPQISKETLLGKIDPATDTNIVPVDRSYTSRSGMFMHSEAYEAFKNMYEAAKRDGIGLVIISAFRDFDHQKRIWENKWSGNQMLYGNVKATDISDTVERAKEILRFSAMPGTSRHHWGTDIDLNSFQNQYFETGEGKKVYEWLMQNAESFGFCQPYTPHGQGREGGYEEEKWHWSYMPVADQYLKAYEIVVNYEDIKGFDGYETAEQIRVIENYVKDINSSCL